MPTRPLLPGMFLTSQSMVSQVSVLSSVSVFDFLSGLWGRTSIQVPSDM